MEKIHPGPDVAVIYIKLSKCPQAETAGFHRTVNTRKTTAKLVPDLYFLT